MGDELVQPRESPGGYQWLYHIEYPSPPRKIDARLAVEIARAIQEWALDTMQRREVES